MTDAGRKEIDKEIEAEIVNRWLLKRVKGAFLLGGAVGLAIILVTVLAIVLNR